MVAPLVLHSWVQRYAFSLGVTLIGFLVTLVLSRITERSLFQVAVAAVAVSAWHGGLWPGLLSAGLSALGMSFFVLAPYSSLRVENVADVLQLGIFLLVAVLMSGLSESRHQAEKTLRTRSEELEAANQELEAFSYTVSHDLRWPLRAIDGYARILIDEWSSRLDDTARRYLGSIRASTKHMDHLLEDLLAFSRLGRQAVRKRTTEPADLVREVLDELKTEQEGRVVEVHVDRLPSCEADPTLLRQVFVNLLQNALKFTRARERAVIEVGWVETEKGWAYFVRDNGVGFNMQHAPQLFGVFQRLHRAGEYEGTGAGLAIVQRIIHRHGGTVWAEAAPEKGATFYFTIPQEGGRA